MRQVFSKPICAKESIGPACADQAVLQPARTAIKCTAPHTQPHTHLACSASVEPTQILLQIWYVLSAPLNKVN